jgi:hypothetical protein
VGRTAKEYWQLASRRFNEGFVLPHQVQDSLFSGYKTIKNMELAEGVEPPTL